MAEAKRYFWMKLHADFFGQKEIKLLRKLAGGDTFTVIYLKMLLRSLPENGLLYYEGIEKDFAHEIALDLDEDVENVQVTIRYLISKGLMFEADNDGFRMGKIGMLIGSETQAAERMRRMRETRKKEPLSAPDRNVVTRQLHESSKGLRDDDAETEAKVEIDKYDISHFPDHFATFWATYPNRKGKRDALKAFKKLHPDEELLAVMLSAIEWQSKTSQWIRDSGQYIPYPATWLNGRRWEDELDLSVQKPQDVWKEDCDNDA